jgi:hypothetical protein
MTSLISHPFRLGPTGSIVVHEQDSDDCYAELLAVMIGTRPGERDQVPQFGINDPTFSTIDPHELTSKLSVFGPPLQIQGITVQPISDTEQDIIVEFTVQQR